MPPLTDGLPVTPGRSYTKLRPGPNGPGPELVARHQRARLYDAMVAMVVARGFEKTTVKGVCALAGVSRRTFYDLFESEEASPKEACFLAAYAYVVGGAAQRIRSSYRGGHDPRSRLRRAFEQFAREVAERPEHARFALVEPLGTGPVALRRMDDGRRLFERMVSASFGDGPDGVTLPPVVVRGVVCGVERITRQWLLAEEAQDLPGLADDLVAWAFSYRSPAVTELVAASPPHRRAAVSRRPEAAVESDRVRVLNSAARLAAAKGYARLTSAQIASAAGVSEERFNELFNSIEQCFLDALDRIALGALVAAATAWRGSEDGEVGVHRAMVALMRHLAGTPCLGQVAFVEIFAVGPAGIERRERLLGQFAKLLSGSLPRSRRPSRLVAEATVGAIWGIAHNHVTRGAARLLPDIAGYATYMALAPVLGADEAVAIISRAGNTASDST
jgi:AcrR family transcriptional regulator